MARRPKGGDPELLLVSFCDIVTVTVSALFMAMVITIQEAMKVPELKGAPRAKTIAKRAPVRLGTGGAGEGGNGGGKEGSGAAGGGTNAATGADGGVIIQVQPTPVYFECRSGMVFPVNYEELYQQTRAARTAPVKKADTNTDGTPKSAIDFLSNMQNQEIGNDYYKVQPSFLMLGQMVLEARPDAKGETEPEVENKGTSKFFAALHKVDKKKNYVVFLVRDDSFPLFKTCRRFVQQEGYDSGWEYLDDDQLIKFGGFGKGAPVPIQ